MTDRWKDGGPDKRLWDKTPSAWWFVSEGACLSAALHAEVSEKKQAKAAERRLHTYSCIQCVFLPLSAHSSSFSSMHAVPSLPPASVSERNLSTGPGPLGSSQDWISNQCYTSCVLATAIFNTQGEAVPGGKGKLSACVGSSMGDIIIRMQWKRLDSKKMDDGPSQCFNFIVIRYSWGGRESGINVTTAQLSALWSIQYAQEQRCKYPLIDQNRACGLLSLICIKDMSWQCKCIWYHYKGNAHWEFLFLIGYYNQVPKCRQRQQQGALK